MVSAGRHQAPQQRPSPFFPEVHDELTRSWHSSYSARLRTSASSALTTVDGAEEKGYERTQTFSKREQFFSSVPHECPASVQPATRVYPTPCHAGHPRSVRVGYGDNKTRLFTPIRSKTPALQRPRHCQTKRLSACAQRHIQRLCLGNRRMRAASIAAEVEWVGGQPVSAQTIRCKQHKIGLH